MNLIIDVGNTKTKLALIQENKVVERLQSKNAGISKLQSILERFPEVNAALLSTVAGEFPELEEYLSSKLSYHRLSHSSMVPFNNSYKTPHTLGTDRIANAAALVSQFPGKNALCVDIGTCIKFDFCDAAGNYHGGSISPGISLRFKAMNDYTSRLPLLSGEKFPDQIIGGDTRDSMRVGVFFGMLNEMEGMISQYRSNFNELQVVITGGDAQHFVPALKSNIFAVPDFTLLGLNKILELNV